MTLQPGSETADELRGGATAARQAHNLEAAGSIPAPATTELSPDAQRVLDVLRQHRGRAQAIHKEALAALTDLNVRHLRQVIVRLIEERGAAIGSVSSEPAGYFLIETAADAELAAQELKTRIIRLAQRLAKLKRNTPADCLDQLRLELATEAA